MSKRIPRNDGYRRTPRDVAEALDVRGPRAEKASWLYSRLYVTGLRVWKNTAARNPKTVKMPTVQTFCSYASGNIV